MLCESSSPICCDHKVEILGALQTCCKLYQLMHGILRLEVEYQVPLKKTSSNPPHGTLQLQSSHTKNDM